MQKDQIIRIVFSKQFRREQFGEGYKSAFDVVRKCVYSVSTMNVPEEAKKEALIKRLQNYWRGQSKYVEGSKREEVQNIVSRVFGIQAQDQPLNEEIRSLDFEGLYLYMCYVVWVVKSDPYVPNLISGRYQEKRSKEMEQKEQKLRTERERLRYDHYGKGEHHGKTI